MPKQVYIVEIDGKQYDIEGDRPPSEAEARAAVGAFVKPQASHDAPKPGIVERATNWLPAIGGTIGGIAGGIGGAAAGGVGAVPGGVGGAMLGGAAGESLRQLAHRAIGADDAPDSPVDALKGIAGEGATQGAAQVVGGLVGKGAGMIGRGLADTVAGRAVQAAVKPAVSQLKQQAGASLEGLTGTTKKMADVLLKYRWTNPAQAQQAIEAAEQKIQKAVATDPNASFQPLLDTATRVPEALRRLTTSAGKQAMPGADVAAIDAAADDVMMGPLAQDTQRTVQEGFIPGREVPAQVATRAMRANITPQEGLEIARATGKWGNRKAWGELKGAAQEASKTTERAIRESIGEAVPKIKPALAEQSEALRVLPVLDRMKWRQGNRDVIGLPAWVMASGHGPQASIGAILANIARSQQLRGGYAAQSVGNALKAVGSHAATTPATSAASRALIEAMRERSTR